MRLTAAEIASMNSEAFGTLRRDLVRLAPFYVDEQPADDDEELSSLLADLGDDDGFLDDDDGFFAAFIEEAERPAPMPTITPPAPELDEEQDPEPPQPEIEKRPQRPKHHDLIYADDPIWSDPAAQFEQQARLIRNAQIRMRLGYYTDMNERQLPLST
jgi:hypothetical protein